jgi:hypothetical protein
VAKSILSLFFIFLALMGLAQPGNTCPPGGTSPNWIADKYTHACVQSEQSCCCADSHSLQSYGCECSERPANDKTSSYSPLLGSTNTERATQSTAEPLNSIFRVFEQSVTFHKLANSKSNPGKLYLLYRALLI